MRRFSTGWRFAVVAAAVVSLFLVPFSQVLSDDRGSFAAGDQLAGPGEVQKREKAPGEVPTFSRANYTWSHATGPFYGDQSLGKQDRNAGFFRTAVGVFDMAQGQPNFPAELKARDNRAHGGMQYLVIQLDPESVKYGSPESVRDVVEANGGSIVRQLPNLTMIARVTPAGRSQVEQSSDVYGTMLYAPAVKLHPSIGRVPLSDPVKAVSEVYELDVRIFSGENSEIVAKSLRALGGNVTAIYPDTIRVEMHRTKLSKVAQIEAVEMVFEHIGPLPYAEETTTTVQTGRYNNGATPYHDVGVDGSGGATGIPQIMMVLDTGIQLDAGELSDTRTDAGTPGTAHRKVRSYATTADFMLGGRGDMAGCDESISGGFTHGHLVSSVALGNATRVDLLTYGLPWLATDPNGNTWRLDGVAPGAVLIAWDAQPTPAATSCQDPLLANIFEGDLYSGVGTGSMGISYTDGARIYNFSWGVDANIYDSNAIDVDDFLVDNREAMVFIAVGNSGLDADNDGTPDEGSVGAPSTSKNALAIGASRAADDQAGADSAQEEERAFFSSVGPSPGNRISPQLLAPGDEQAGGTMGLSSEFGCRSSDNDQDNPVQCDTFSGKEGTSFSSPAAAGAGLLVRDYFAQGFYPQGEAVGGNETNISGALVKSVLISSAQFLIGDKPPSFTAAFPGGDNLTVEYRFNNEQGYGRVKLDNALPLNTWAAGVSGLLVQDLVIPAGPRSLGTLVQVAAGQTAADTFEVCNADQELRVSLSWLDPSNLDGSLTDNINLRLISPMDAIGDQRVYHGNYYTDDDNRNGTLDANEDCPGIDGATGALDESEWSLPACQRADLSISPFDTANNTESIVLSPDPAGDESLPSQIELGEWTIEVIGDSGLLNPVNYAVAISGGVCNQSWAQLDAVEYSCNSTAAATIYELPEAGDLDPSTAEVQARTTVQVVSAGIVVDEEPVNLIRPDEDVYKFEADALVLTNGTQRDPGNGALDVRDGDTIRVVYQDTTGTRISDSIVDCTVNLGFGSIVFAQFGQDTTFFVAGGCERNARDQFEFGFPDRYMDGGESLSFNFAFASNEENDLNNVDVDLRCVLTDTNSPADCRPNSLDCADPNRSDNVTCDGRAGFGGIGPQAMDIVDTPKTIGVISANSGLSANFTIQMEPTIAGTPVIEMILLVDADTSGKTSQAIAISRHTLDVDESSVFYSTDFPMGGMEMFDQSQERAGDEILQNPTTNAGNFQEDYRFETRTWSDLTAGGNKNLGLLSPWNFDANDGNFRSGLLATTDESSINDIIAQWGEDKNFNNTDDSRCTLDETQECDRDADCDLSTQGTCVSVEDRDEAGNGILDRSWNTRGGCGWQTKAPGTCSNDPTAGCFDNDDCPGTATCTGAAADTGGIWHTGRIYGTTGDCLVIGNNPGQCQSYEIVGGTGGVLSWREHLITPIMSKVNGDNFTIEIMEWRWNQAVELADSNAAWVWEFDTDTSSIEPVDLFSDNSVLNGLFGAYGAVGGSNNPDLTNGFSMFAPLDQAGNTWNGDDDATVPDTGNDRHGKNSCFFEGAAVDVATVCPDCPKVSGDLGFTGPLDNNIDDDDDSIVDEYVTDNGPVRNMDMFAVNGPDMRFSTFEDLYGDTAEFFQGSVGIWNFEATAAQDDNKVSYGLGIDDMVVEWREFELVQDDSNCAIGGECAVIDVLSVNTYEGSTLLTLTVVDKTPDAVNDCDLDGMPDNPSKGNDCDENGTPDVPVLVATDGGELPPGEVVIINLTSTPNTYRGDLPISAKYDSPGVLFIVSLGTGGTGSTGGTPVTATYRDNDDGTGSLCANDVAPDKQGRVQAQTEVFLETSDIAVIATQSTDNGDGDAFADTRETIDLRITLTNKGTATAENLAARLATNDPKIDCILNSFVNIGDVGPGETITTDASFKFQVADVDRSTNTPPLTDLDDFSAQFQILFAADDFDGTSVPQTITIDLDLDASGGVCNDPPCLFEEGWEGLSNVNCNDEAIPGDPLTKGKACRGFQAINKDVELQTDATVDGYRCQYSDPDWINSLAYAGGVTDCFLAPNPAHAERFWWQINTPADINLGKAYSGSNSLYMGDYGPAPDTQTTPVGVLEFLEQIDPINLGLAGAPPELSFKHQVDFMDSRTVNVNAGQSPARGVVSLQLANTVGGPVGDWIRLEPFLNIYDTQAQDQYFSCSFDPIDDGNDEDSFFDPTDPDRRTGPSTSCFPNLAFVYMGETFNPFNDGALGLGLAEGPGLQGSLGLGTWVESKFNLERFRGRSVRLRFMYTDLKAGGGETWETLFENNPAPGDDGWWLDDLLVSNTLDSPASISNDDKDNSGLDANCASNCSQITPILTRDPVVALAAPGQVVTFDAIDSFPDRCLNGTLQYQFSGNGTLLRGWTDNSVLIDAPLLTTTYLMEARCSTATSCINSTSVEVVVLCPNSGNLTFPGLSATAPLGSTPTSLDWGVAMAYDWASGDLATLDNTYPSSGGSGSGAFYDISGDTVNPDAGLWYLFRGNGGGGSTFCNDLGTNSWGTAQRDNPPSTLP